MISLTQLSMAYSGKLLFYDVNLLLSDNKRYALIGANGAGKSTLFKLITGEEEPASGEISIPKEDTIGWLKQDQYRYEDTTLVNVVIQGKSQLWKALVEKEQLLSNENWDEKAAHRIAEVEEIINHFNGYSAEAFAEKLLLGLGIKPEFLHQPLRALSGGYKLRVLLAQALFQEPNILLLDEPTNHLDIVSIDWLEKYLKNEFKGLLIFISHDMDFINHLAHNILDVDYGEIRQYSGNYEKFLSEKQLIEEQKLSTRKNLELKIADMQKFVDRFKAKASKAKQAQSRMKMIEKIELPDISHSSRIAPNFHFEINRPSGKLSLKVNDLSKQYEEAPIFNHINFQIQRGEKVVIAGANGIGKSTLVKILMGVTQASTGNYEWGYESHLSYFSQDHHDLLNHHSSALDWLTEQVKSRTDQHIRKALGQVLFTQDEALKDILSLSGGEAARLLLARIMLEHANVLVLDEPTNHMDIESIEGLAKALIDYPGTVIVVSHNRHFISRVATRILFVSKEKGLQDFQGSYAEFDAQIQELGQAKEK